MRQSRQYKSPWAAMLWSVVLPGLGQLYNKDYLIGFLLIVLEFLVNMKSKLNIALIYSFNGDLNAAHHAVDYSWALFYPSIYGYALWQAFNAAKANNGKLDGREGERRTYFSGFFIGLVIGMDFGLFWHDSRFIVDHSVIRLLDFPLYNGIFLGGLLGIIGHIMENKVYRKYKAVNYG